MIKRLCVLFLFTVLFVPGISGQTDKSIIVIPADGDMYRTIVRGEPILNISNDGFIVGITPYVVFYQPSMYYIISFDLAFSSVGGFDQVLMSESISTGSYEFKDGEYIFYDLNAGYTMSAKLEYGKLKFTEGLPFLKEMKWLVYDQQNKFSKVNDCSFIDTELIEDLPLTKDAFPTFKPGRFGDKIDTYLKLKRNSTYTFDYSGIRLSDGTYCQSGKYIILQDQNVNAKFYLEIMEDNNIKPVKMPFMDYLFRQGLFYYRIR